MLEIRVSNTVPAPSLALRSAVREWRGAWTTATPYVVFDVVEHNGGSYIAIGAHTSGASTEPGIGASWETVWGIQAEAGEDGDDFVIAGIVANNAARDSQFGTFPIGTIVLVTAPAAPYDSGPHIFRLITPHVSTPTWSVGSPFDGAAALLASQAEAEAGSENTKTMTALRAAQAIQNFDWLSIGSTIARSNKDRWSDTVYVMDHGLDPTGATANLHTAFAAALTEAQARTRSEIRLPPGILKLGGTCALINPAGQHIRIIGAGISTRIAKNAGTGNWFDIGNVASARTYDIIFEDMVLEPTVSMTEGYMFNMRNTSDVRFRSVDLKSVLNGWAMGLSAVALNDVIYTDLTDCSAFSKVGGAGTMISLGSGGVLNIKGGNRWNGDGTSEQTLIKQVTTTLNWDGLYVYDLFSEDFNRYIRVEGHGIGNMQWRGGQVDGFAIAFDTSNMAVSGLCRHWQLNSIQFLNGTNPLIWLAGSGEVTDVQFHNNIIGNVTSYVQIGAGTYGSIVGNTFHNPGAATPLVRFGGKGVVNSNISLVTSGTAPTFGIQWDGASDPDRSATGNEWDGAGGNETGTP